MNNYIVYIHISPSNKRYIGITCQKPERRWRGGSSYKHNEYFTNAINKYGWDNFEHIIIAKGLTKEEAEWLEIELIREWDTTSQDKGYNITKGGKGANGLKGELNPMYGLKGELNPNYGLKRSKETKEKMSKALKGREFTEEWKQNLSENHANVNSENNPNAIKIICLETMEIFNCINDASKKINCNYGGLRKAIKKHKKYKGYTFMYYEDYLKTLE